MQYDHVVISIPINYEQGESHGNVYEKHLSIWNWEQLDWMFSDKYKVRKLIGNIAIFIK